MYFASITAVGLLMYLGAVYLDRTISQYEPELSVIQPLIPQICFVAKTLGLMISAAGSGLTLASVW